MKHLLIVYHSQTGHTEAMAGAVIAGASDPLIEGVEVRARGALEADAADVLWSDALILGTPENFGYMSGALKYFFDRIYYPCLQGTQGRPYALFIRAGNDGRGALSSIERIVEGLKWRRVQDPIVVAGDFDDACLEHCRELGMSMAAGLEAGIF
jgi:multimeric flavodoxin WrbA